jgi:hypothetical protein
LLAAFEISGPCAKWLARCCKAMHGLHNRSLAPARGRPQVACALAPYNCAPAPRSPDAPPAPHSHPALRAQDRRQGRRVHPDARCASGPMPSRAIASICARPISPCGCTRITSSVPMLASPSDHRSRGSRLTPEQPPCKDHIYPARAPLFASPPEKWLPAEARTSGISLAGHPPK